MKALALIVLCFALIGCAAPGTGSEFRVEGAGYAAAFDAARQTLIDARFDLERVDARAGVITTRPKSTAGLATPWDAEQSSISQEVEDLANQQQRTIRVWFEPEIRADPAPEDLRHIEGPMVVRVEVVIERVHKPGWRIETTAVRFSSFSRDPELTERAMWPRYSVAFAQDPEYAGRLAHAIERRIKR